MDSNLEKELLVEATRQLGLIMTRNLSPFMQLPPKGFLRGIDFYKASVLPHILASTLNHYKNMTGAYPDLSSPRGLNEKIIWFKLFGTLKVPESGNKLLTSSFIPPELHGTVRCPEIIWHSKFPRLPDNSDVAPGDYYLKANHGSQMFRRVEYPLRQRDRRQLEELCAKWLGTSYGIYDGEWWYNTFPREILLERSVSDTAAPDAWGFFTFRDTMPHITVTRKTMNGLKVLWLDGSGEKMESQNLDHDELREYEIPPGFEKARRTARTIGSQFEFARVDFLFDSEGGAYLNEITFTPGNGLNKRLEEFDNYLGDFWKLG